MDICREVRQSVVVQLVNYATINNFGLIIASDTNCHSSLFGPDQNKRGDELDELIFEFGLTVHNRCHTPTYRRYNASTCVDATFSLNLHNTVTHWEVDPSFNASDHSLITFNYENTTFIPERHRNWNKIDFGICLLYTSPSPRD